MTTTEEKVDRIMKLLKEKGYKYKMDKLKQKERRKFAKRSNKANRGK